MLEIKNMQRRIRTEIPHRKMVPGRASHLVLKSANLPAWPPKSLKLVVTTKLQLNEQRFHTHHKAATLMMDRVTLASVVIRVISEADGRMASSSSRKSLLTC